MFLKSIADLIYNSARSPSNASYLLEYDCVNMLSMMRDEISDIVDARKVNMTMLLTLSYLVDDNNYDIIVPQEGLHHFVFFSSVCVFFKFKIFTCRRFDSDE